MEVRFIRILKPTFQISLCLFWLLGIGRHLVYAKTTSPSSADVMQGPPAQAKETEKSQPSKPVEKKSSRPDVASPRCVELITKEHQDLQKLKSKQQKREHFLHWYERFSQASGPDPLSDMEGSLEWSECVLILSELEGALKKANFSCEETWDRLEFLFPPSEEGKMLSSLKAVKPLLFELCR